MLRLAAVVALLALGSSFHSTALAANCGVTSRGYVPLNDLGPGSYFGFQGGLYPGGSNQRPAAHNAAGVAIASSIVPLDTLGNPDPVNGRVVLISIGMSNCTQEFSTFVPKAMTLPGRNPRLLVIDCAQGGQAAQDIVNPAAPYWQTVRNRLRAAGSAPAQVQAVWIKQAMRGPTDSLGNGQPSSTDTLQWYLGTIVRNIRDLMPNAKLAYLTSRIYAGYASTPLNPEPYAYESGFSVKWLIESQIGGADSLNYDPDRGPVEAPWLAWGPYLWADGLAGRADGMTWRCDQFVDDGTHPSVAGRNVVADSLLAFFRFDETTAPWFLASGTVGVAPSPGSVLSLAAAPNPAASEIALELRAPARAAWRLEIVDLGGRRVRDLGRGTGSAATERVRWDGRGGDGTRVPAGVYWARLASAGRTRTVRLVVLAER